MATFDSLIDDLASRFGLGANARTLVKEVLTMISTSPGGLGGFLDKLKSAGLTSEVASWLGRPDAAPIAAGQVERALGATALRGDCEPARPRPERRVDRARIRLAEDRRPLDAGRRRSGRRAAEVTAFLSQPRAAAATEQVAPKRIDALPAAAESEPDHPALAVAGARRAGRRRRPFLFLVDPQPDPARSAGRQGARAGHAPPPTVAQAPPPPPAPAPAAQAPAPPPPPRQRLRRQPQPRLPAPQPTRRRRRLATASACSRHEGDGLSTAGACSRQTARSASSAAARTAPPQRPAAPATPRLPAVATAEPTAPASAATPTRFALSNDNGAGARVRRCPRPGRQDVDHRRAQRGLRRRQSEERHRRRPERDCGACGSASSAPRSTRSKARMSTRSSRATRSTSAAPPWTTPRATRSSRR